MFSYLDNVIIFRTDALPNNLKRLAQSKDKYNIQIKNSIFLLLPKLYCLQGNQKSYSLPFLYQDYYINSNTTRLIYCALSASLRIQLHYQPIFASVQLICSR